MAIVTGDRYLEKLVNFVNQQAGPLIEGTLVLKLNPAGLHYVQSRLEALHELEKFLAGAPVDYLRAYVSDLGDHRALEHLRRILRLLTSLKVVSVLPPPVRDPTPLSFLPFGRLKVLELRGCDLSTSAARGLLELRHTLEKIICHNSTDALRHLFASRIAEIKNSPQWNRLSFVSCACNGLILMDESLQLLPAVETLDLSRNRFTKVDNLRKCAKLKHLDLGFNQLRTIAPFTEVCRHIVKLVLRNNALTTLRGIEHLKSLEGLDVSYNIISKFSEIEILAGLSSLRSLWLEGNPLCCARWYRAHVFSLFTYPEKLKLDDKEVNTKDLWKRQIIMARKHKQPASFGFYLPAKDEAIEEGGTNRRRRTVSRLALIESGEEVTDIFSDQESVSCDNESQKREDPHNCNDEAEVVDLINRVELMKKENSSLWLQEFKDWMDISSDKLLENSKEGMAAFYHQKEHFMKSKPSRGQSGEVSRYASDSFLASGDESSTMILESDNSFVDMSAGFLSQKHFDHRGSFDNADLSRTVREHLKPYALEGISIDLMHSRNSHTSQGGYKMGENVNISPLTTFDGISRSYSSSGFPSSPPHYQEDLLHRRQDLVEEILQLSADSFSVASSNSNTSCSEVDCGEFEQSAPEVNDVSNIHYSNGSVDVQISLNQLKGKLYGCGQEISHARENGIFSFDPSSDHTSKQWFNDPAIDSDNNEGAYTVNQDANLLENKKHRKKAKKRVISILDEGFDGDEFEQEQNNQRSYPSEYQGVVGKRVMSANVKRKLDLDDFSEYPGANFYTRKSDDFIVTYFNASMADSEAHETCSRCIRCSFVLQRDSIYREREVAVLLSSHKKLYVLLISVAADGSGTLLSLLSCHKSKEICEVVVGMGLQVVRVNFDGGGGYLFITRSIEKSRELLWVLQVSDSSGANERCSVRSLEQVQVQLFESQVCGGLDVNIYQYAMVLVSRSSNEELWQPRSLFVMGGHVLLCSEDVSRFCSISSEASLPSYFRIDSCCFITDVTEVALEIEESYCVTLALKRLMSEFQPSAQANVEAVTEGKVPSGFLKLKLRWFSKCDLLKFTTLLKAIHAEKTESPLVVRC